MAKERGCTPVIVVLPLLCFSLLVLVELFHDQLSSRSLLEHLAILIISKRVNCCNWRQRKVKGGVL